MSPDAETPTYQGSCQCGAVTFTARTRLEAPFQCNCSRCRRLNAVMHSVPDSDFVLESGGEALKTFRFNSHTIAHQFCTVCGIQPFASGTDRDGRALHVVNVNCLDNPVYDPGAITRFNGADF
ncbi:GFA family protein [Pelagibacterium sp. 26DY04]|uniref:GFA family protein n=1 Tax=Pelagibacterium sp. 26DY04 TaxID=2967130 RepID=UPI0028163F5E|nr:GFA family protein [Pelagibacterium sp. 26DY04]WMT87109.1 GFA family protein [Pelagibacterium sp. 26DY04]